MDEKDKKGGFSGLSDLTSDIKKPELKSERKSEDEPLKDTFDPINLTKWPTMPAPWLSEDAGETWIWGDFFLTFQKNPKPVIVLLSGNSQYKAMTYHYAMTVFYRLEKNPAGRSQRPIMVIAIEQSNIEELKKMLGDKGKDIPLFEGGKEIGPPMIGLFISDKRENLGEYEGEISPEPVKKLFFEILRKKLGEKQKPHGKWIGKAHYLLAGRMGVSGEPRLIGNMNKAHGHKETGLPSRNRRLVSVLKVLLMVGIFVVGIWMFGRENKPNGLPSESKYDIVSIERPPNDAVSNVINGIAKGFWSGVAGFATKISKFVQGGINDDSGKKSNIPEIDISELKPVSSQKSNSGKQSAPAQTAQAPKPAQKDDFYTKPPVGDDNVLSVPEIRWCIRQGIIIEAKRNILNTNSQIGRFNKVVDDYNDRCGSYRYRKGDQSQAEKDVAPYRQEIIAQAVAEAKK
jgi:hypothetical protein